VICSLSHMPIRRLLTPAIGTTQLGLLVTVTVNTGAYTICMKENSVVQSVGHCTEDANGYHDSFTQPHADLEVVHYPQ